MATIAIVAIGFLLMVLGNAQEGKNDALEKISIAAIVTTIAFVGFAVIVDQLGYRF